MFFHEVVSNGHRNCLKFLIEAMLEVGVNLNATDCKQRTLLHVAAKNGHTECARMLLTMNCSRNLRDQAGRSEMDLAIRD